MLFKYNVSRYALGKTLSLWYIFLSIVGGKMNVYDKHRLGVQ